MIKRQQEFELESHRSAINKIRNEIRKAKDKHYYSSTKAGHKTLTHFIIPFDEALRETTANAVVGNPTRTVISRTCHLIQQLLDETDEYVLSTIALKSILDCYSSYEKVRLSNASMLIGRRIEDEIRFNFYQDIAPEDVASAARKRVNQTGSNPHYRSYSTKKITEDRLLDKGFTKDDLFPNWSNTIRADIGVYILDVACAEGYVSKETTQQRAGKKQSYLELSPELEYILISEEVYKEELAYTAWPLIEPPLDWININGPSRFNYSGGYFHEWIRKQLPFCRGFHYNSEFGDEAIKLANTLQHTAWNIDADVYNVANELVEKGVTLGSFRALFHDPRLDQGMPLHLQDLPTDHNDRKDWRRSQAQLHERHEKERRKSIRSRQAIAMASTFVNESRFYLSWSCDFRGRFYTHQPWLQPQTNDLERSIVTFSDGCKLDTRGELWAAHALGSAYLGSQKSFNERTKWTHKNKELIKAVADSPINMISYCEQAKEPWQFLQLALEWNRVVLTKDKHLWDVPVGADSTASGLQILSAMRRDPVGMKFSNLLPPETPDAEPQDAYMEVLRVARVLAGSSEETKHLVEFLHHRSVGKPVLMVSIYGGSASTNRKNIIQAYTELGMYPDPIGYQDANQIEMVLRKASKQVFPMAFEALDWLKKLSKQAFKNGSADLKWNTPTNDLIHLAEYVFDSQQIHTSHLGKVTIPIGETNKPSYKDMNSGFAPNFVHSYDAAVLKASFQQWNHPIALIHDCIRVLPNDMDRAMERIRKAFVRVCSGDRLAQLADDLEVPSTQLKRLTQGSGDLHSVLESQYMFN